MTRSRIPDTRAAAILGSSLGGIIVVCFVTGLYSHILQQPPGWFTPFPRPAGLYRFSQGLHIAAGLASIPILLAKLWVVYPKLFTWPPFESPGHAVERAALLPLIGGSLFLALSGLNNINLVYPYSFSFRAGHYATAWVVVGALVVHATAKFGTARHALRPDDSGDASLPTLDADHGRMSRRGVLAAAFGSAAIVSLFTVGQTFAPLRRLALLAPRRPDTGPQGFPVNRTAASVGLERVDLDAFLLRVDGPAAARALNFTYEQLRALPQHEATLPIACVEGWSASRRWRGVRVRDLLEAAGARAGAEVIVESLQEHPLYRRSRLSSAVAHDRDTLLALEVEGEVLHPDHGFPCRLIAPNRPGVQQTKWVTRIEVT